MSAAPLVIEHPQPNLAWLNKLREEVLEPDLPIIDPHHHLWDRPGSRYYLDELLADTGSGHNVVATVFLQCFWAYRTSGPEALRPVGETEFVAAIAAEAERRQAKTRACAAIVGHADLRLGERVDEVLEAHVAAAGGRFRGIRHGVARHPALLASISEPPPLGLMADSSFRAGFAQLAKHGMSFDAWLYHTQLDELYDLARAFPGTPIVLNHVGGPLGVGPFQGKSAEVFATWQASMRRLAACPNVHVKLGGLAMAINGFDFHRQVLPPSSGELVNAWRPWMSACIELFGATRCMFESNFPVDKAMCSYPVLWNAFKRIAAGASADEKRALFHDTAARFYRI
ncbi:MAG TPA: amidohydrolase family protein [Acetobacteraceae bacterium]|nr:amidohydrolase family protein [Acetobacteraceae bacterium]